MVVLRGLPFVSCFFVRRLLVVRRLWVVFEVRREALLAFRVREPPDLALLFDDGPDLREAFNKALTS